MRSQTQSPARSGRRISGRSQSDSVLDPYQLRHKPEGPARCPQCTAVYSRGRWSWTSTPANARDHLCPACRRVNDRFPAGTVTLHRVPARLKDQVIGLVRNEEATEKGEHPLNRVMAVQEQGDGLVVTTTDIHLPRRIGNALKQAYRGELAIDFDENSYSVRVDWTPPEPHAP
jgi:hypothetical protein